MLGERRSEVPYSYPEAPGAFNGRTDTSMRNRGGGWDPVSKPGYLKALNQSGASGQRKIQGNPLLGNHGTYLLNQHEIRAMAGIYWGIIFPLGFLGAAKWTSSNMALACLLFLGVVGRFCNHGTSAWLNGFPDLQQLCQGPDTNSHSAFSGGQPARFGESSWSV